MGTLEIQRGLHCALRGVRGRIGEDRNMLPCRENIYQAINQADASDSRIGNEEWCPDSKLPHIVADVRQCASLEPDGGQIGDQMLPCYSVPVALGASAGNILPQRLLFMSSI